MCFYMLYILDSMKWAMPESLVWKSLHFLGPKILLLLENVLRISLVAFLDSYDQWESGYVTFELVDSVNHTEKIFKCLPTHNCTSWTTPTYFWPSFLSHPLPWSHPCIPTQTGWDPGCTSRDHMWTEHSWLTWSASAMCSTTQVQLVSTHISIGHHLWLTFTWSSKTWKWIVNNVISSFSFSSSTFSYCEGIYTTLWCI